MRAAVACGADGEPARPVDGDDRAALSGAGGGGERNGAALAAAQARGATEGDPLRELDMRLTYRTVRVLLAIAELGGGESSPSNRRSPRRRVSPIRGRSRSCSRALSTSG